MSTDAADTAAVKAAIADLKFELKTEFANLRHDLRKEIYAAEYQLVAVMITLSVLDFGLTAILHLAGN